MSSELERSYDWSPHRAELVVDHDSSVATVNFPADPNAVDILRLGDFYFHFDADRLGILSKIEYPFNPDSASAAPILPIEESPDGKLGSTDRHVHTAMKLIGVGLWDELRSTGLIDSRKDLDEAFTVVGRDGAEATRLEVHLLIKDSLGRLVPSGLLDAELRGAVKHPNVHKLRRSRMVRIAAFGVAAIALVGPAYRSGQAVLRANDQILALEDANNDLRNSLSNPRILLDDIDDGAFAVGDRDYMPSIPNMTATTMLDELDYDPAISDAVVVMASSPGDSIDELNPSDKQRVRRDLDDFLDRAAVTMNNTDDTIDDLTAEEGKKLVDMLELGSLGLAALGVFGWRQLGGPRRFVRNKSKIRGDQLRW